METIPNYAEDLTREMETSYGLLPRVNLSH
jgi:hypothetical protein